MLERVRAVPGVVSASLVSDVPLSGGSSATFYTAEGDTTTDAQTVPRAYVHRVSPTFFETMRIPVTSGRTFTDADATPTGLAVIVSDNVARRFWPNQNPIGRRIKLGMPAVLNPWLEIVGTVAETKYRSLPRNPTADPDVYFPALDRSPQPILLRTAIDPAAVSPAVRVAIRQNRPTIALYGETTMTALANGQTSASRFTTWIYLRVVGEDLPLEPLQLSPGSMPELVERARARRGRPRAPRPAGPSGRARASAGRAGARGADARDQRLELADELGVAAEREVGVDALLERREAQVVEPAASIRANGSSRTPASAGPRQSASASRSSAAACSGSPRRARSARRAARTGAGRARPARPRAGSPAPA